MNSAYVPNSDYVPNVSVGTVLMFQMSPWEQCLCFKCIRGIEISLLSNIFHYIRNCIHRHSPSKFDKKKNYSIYSLIWYIG